MKLISSALSVSTLEGISGSYMWDSGLEALGTIVVDVPLDPHITYVDDTVSFSQDPHKIYKYGDCEHFKIQGTAYRPSNNGPIKPTWHRSVFGPIYDQEGVASNIVARTTGSYESYVHVRGNYSGCSNGLWYFAIAAERVGSLVFGVTGQADLYGSNKYPGHYQFSLTEFRVSGSIVESRATNIVWYSNDPTPRTSSERPLKALASYKEKLLSKIQGEKWYQWGGGVYRLFPINPSEARFPSYCSVFPTCDMQVKWGDLAADAYNSVPFFKSNGVAYTSDLLHLKESAVKTLSLISSFSKMGKYANKIANLFLSYYYGWRLFVKDTQELYGAIEKRSHSFDYLNRATSQRRWSAHGADYLATFQCIYNRYAHMSSSLDRFIIDYDLALTPENLWDLVPFSFVVDWFIGVGAALESASNYYTFTQRHEVLCTGRSIKATKDISASQLHCGWQGTLKCSYYRRFYVEGAISPTFFFSNSVNPLDHVVEGSALIVSRR